MGGEIHIYEYEMQSRRFGDVKENFKIDIPTITTQFINKTVRKLFTPSY